MEPSMVARALILALALVSATPAAAQDSASDPTTLLILRVERAMLAGDSAALLALAVDPDVPGLRAFAAGATPPPTRLVIKERDRAALGRGQRLLLEILTEHGNQATITTWRMDLVTGADATAPARRIAEMEQLTVVSGLYKLTLNPTRQYEVRNLTLHGTDLSLEMAAGQAFVAEIEDGPTAVVLLGRGRAHFAPGDAAERTQLRIFGGEESLTTEFDAAFVRIRPAEFDRAFAAAAMVTRAVSPGDLRRATEIFDSYVGQTLNLDLTDLSRERWSLIPTAGDLIVELRTRRHGNLTYARSLKDAEDISLFDRRRRRNISTYASAHKLASRGPSYSEDELVDYDVLEYDIDAAFSPERPWLDGQARLRLRVRATALTSLTFRLAEPLAVRSVISPEHGRLLHLRVVGQNGVIVNFPKTLPQGAEIWLHVVYGGRLEPQLIDREGVTVSPQVQGAQDVAQEVFVIPLEPQFIYSNRSYWYPQATVTDYATARLRVSVPSELDVVATGIAAGPPTPITPPPTASQRPRTAFTFQADQPVRYLSCLMTRLTTVTTRTVTVPPLERVTSGGGEERAPPAGGPAPRDRQRLQANPAVALTVLANPRQVSRARSLSDRAGAILEYFGSLVGDAPYPAFTLAVTENDVPGGHSPAYFALLNQTLPMMPMLWRNDPVAFDGYPPYFLAHEIAHQWWGQAVGWKNYHEQWLSEGFAQYFAVLYAGRDRGNDQFEDMLRQMRRWALEQSPQGPVYLGYRLGHIKGDSRVFRAVLYNKGAMVLHMLRRLVGDEAFFAGIRSFYQEWRFRKAGTADFRAVMERVSGRALGAFFNAWIYRAETPSLTFGTTMSSGDVLVRFEHRGEVIPVPVTVSIAYADGRRQEVVVAVTERVVDQRIPLTGTVRSIEANRDGGAVAEISR